MSNPPLPSNIGKKRTIKDISGNEQRFTVLDEVTQVQSTYHDKVIYLQRIQFENDGRIELRLAYYIIGKKPKMAGKFMRGSSKDDADAYDDEKPQRKIYLDDFMIGKYPVTNEEFKEFVDDGGYGKDRKDMWSEEGWRWREGIEILEPAYLHDRKWNGPNFPVVGISWFEASAYAKWLSERTGHQYRLPTEAEWEKAARGNDGFKYPWGEHFDKNLCNSGESGLNRTSPVGIFPKGKSHSDCFDMAGNVWEWCSDWYDSDYYANGPDINPKGPSGGDDRVNRGGCWFNSARDCRSAQRDRNDPATAATTSAFAFFRKCNYFLLYHFTTYMLYMSALPEGSAYEAAQPEVQR